MEASATSSGRSFRSCNSMANGTYVLEIDWNADGDWGDTAENVTANTLECVWSRGRDYASQLSGRATAGKLSARLDNSTGIY